MSSLPQGWHGIPVPSRNGALSSTASAAAAVPTTIRKKWNSPLSSEVPRSKLPAYRPSTSRLAKNSTSNASPVKPTTKSTCPTPQNELTSCTTKSPVKQYQNEIANLKKELANVKTENSILKVKVRRVDDENIQKSRQIEKLRVELKAVQKIDPTNSKKSKDSELLLLRQKCLRLEGALKEKDLALNTYRKLNSGTFRRDGNSNTNSTAQHESGDACDVQKEKLSENKTTGKSSLTASLSRSSHTKSEVMKLREMIHKLEKGNQELQQQVKDKGEEIRRLKLHLRSQTYVKPSESVVTKSAPKLNNTFTKSSSHVPKQDNKTSKNSEKSNSTAAKSVKPSPVSKVKKSSVQSIPKPSSKVQGLSQKGRDTGKVSTTGNTRMQPSKKQVNGVSSKLPVTNNAKTFVVRKPIAPKVSDVIKVEKSTDDKVQHMRENIAAKKIQRTWRIHQKQKAHKEDHPNQKKALTFIVSSLKHHKLRKTKLNMLQKRKNISPKLKVENESVVIEAIQEATKNLWIKELNVAH